MQNINDIINGKENVIIKTREYTKNELRRNVRFNKIVGQYGSIIYDSYFYYGGELHLVEPQRVLKIRNKSNYRNRREITCDKKCKEVFETIAKIDEDYYFAYLLGKRISCNESSILYYQGEVYKINENVCEMACDRLSRGVESKEPKDINDLDILKFEKDEKEGDEDMINEKEALEKEEAVVKNELKSHEVVFKRSKNPNKGFVYLIRNPASGSIKIGLTTRWPDDRLNEMNEKTEVELPFELIAAEYARDCLALEKHMHEVFKDKRVNRNREFFKIDEDEAIVTLARESAKFNEILNEKERIN